jgi:hypothetical protein
LYVLVLFVSLNCIEGLAMNFLKNKNILWLFELLFFLGGFYIVYRYYGGSDSSPAPKAEKKIAAATQQAASVINKPQVQRPADTVTLETAVVCLDIDEEAVKPLLARGVFSKYIDYLYCYAEFSSAAPEEIVFYWIYKDSIIAEKRTKPLKTPSVAWSRMSMSSEKTGEWRVDIRTVQGDYLGSTDFILR